MAIGARVCKLLRLWRLHSAVHHSVFCFVPCILCSHIDQGLSGRQLGRVDLEGQHEKMAWCFRNGYAKFKSFGVNSLVASSFDSIPPQTNQDTASQVTSTGLYLLQPQIIHKHIPAQRDPSIAKPNHLAHMRLRHGLPGRRPATPPKPVHKHQRSRVLLLHLDAPTTTSSSSTTALARPAPRRQRARRQRGKRVQHAGVLARDVDGR